jgi:hypothetical protein
VCIIIVAEEEKKLIKISMKKFQVCFGYWKNIMVLLKIRKNYGRGVSK